MNPSVNMNGLKGFGGELPYGSLTDTFNITNNAIQLGAQTKKLDGSTYVLMRGCTGLTYGAAVLFDNNFNTVLAEAGGNLGNAFKGLAIYVGSTQFPANSSNTAGYFMVTGNALVQATGVTLNTPLYMSSTPGVLTATAGAPSDLTGITCTSNPDPLTGLASVFAYSPIQPGGTISAAVVSQGSPFAGGSPLGIVFVDASGNLQTLPNFNFDPATNKFTLSGPGAQIDPQSFVASDTTGGKVAFYQGNAGSNTPVSAPNTGRLRYNDLTDIWEQSVNGGAWMPLGSSGVFVGSGVQTGSDYVTTYTPSTPTLSAGVEIVFIPDADSVGNDTINLAPIQKQQGGALAPISAGDLLANIPYVMTYDGANFNVTIVGTAPVTQIPDWQTATAYVVDQPVFTEGRLYRANTAHTSTTFNADRANWDVVVTVQAGNAFQANFYYYANDTIINNNTLYQRISSGISGATFSADIANWNLISSPDTLLPDWATATDYAVNEIVYNETRVYRCNTAHTSTTFNADRANWDVIETVQAGAGFTPNFYYYANDTIIVADIMYQRIGSGTSGPLFDLPEQAFWNRVGDIGNYIGTGVLTAGDYVTTYTPGTPVLSPGLDIIFLPDVNSLGGETLNGDPIVQQQGNTLVPILADTFLGGLTYILTYNGSVWAVTGTDDPIAALHQSTINTNTTLLGWNQTVFADTTGGPLTVVLPTGITIANEGQSIEIKNSPLSQNQLTIQAPGAETIDDSNTFIILKGGESVVLRATGTTGTGSNIVAAYKESGGWTILFAPQTMVAGNNYIGLASGTYTLPAGAAPGDTIEFIASATGVILSNPSGSIFSAPGTMSSNITLPLYEKFTVFSVGSDNWSIIKQFPARTSFGDTASGTLGTNDSFLSDLWIVNQTTASQALLFPAGLSANATFFVQVQNIGTADFTLEGFTVSAGTTVPFIWNGTSWTAPVPASVPSITVWAPATAYAVGDVVSNNQSVYINNVAHTSGATFDATEASNFTPISNYVNIAPFVGNTYYPAGVIVSDGNGRYVQRLTAGTSAAGFTVAEAQNWSLVRGTVTQLWSGATIVFPGEFRLTPNTQDLIQSTSLVPFQTAGTFATDFTNWSLVTINANITAWAPSVVYFADDIVSTGTRTVKRIATGVSGGTFSNAEAALWTLVTSPVTTNWTASTYYYAGENVYNNGVVYQRITSGISGTQFDGAESANWVAQGVASVISPWTASTFYPAGSLVTQGSGRVLERITSGTSAATFNLGEASAWSLVMPQNPIPVWNPLTLYFQNEQVYHPATGDLLTKTTATSVSLSAFNTLESANYTVAQYSINNTTSFVPNVYYYAGSVITNNFINYRRTVAGLGGASFNALEQQNWDVIGEQQYTPLHVNSTQTGSFTVLPEFGETSIVPGAPVTVTLDATCPDGKRFYFNGTVSTTNTVTFVPGAGTSLVSPVSGLSVPSWKLTGNNGNFYNFSVEKINTQWQFHH